MTQTAHTASYWANFVTEHGGLTTRNMDGMSTAARLDIGEQPVAPTVTHLDTTALDLTSSDPIIDLGGESLPPELEVHEDELLLATDSFESQTDDPAMLFVYVGTVLFLVLVVVSALLALG